MTEASLSIIGRAGISSLFFLGGVNKLLTFTETSLRMTEVGLVPASLLLPATIVLEILGGICLVYGRWPGVVSAACLAVFTLATNLFFHRFWEMDPPIASLELSLFFKNVAIVGALIFVIAIERSRVRADGTGRTHADVR